MEDTKKTSERLGNDFISPDEVAAAEAQHVGNRLNMSPAQLAVVTAADAAMREVESIFEGKIDDRDIAFLLDVFRQSGVPDTPANREALRSAIVRKKPGEYFALGTQVFFVTGDRSVQEAKAYVNRLEKTVIKIMNAKSVSDARVAELERQLAPKKSLLQRVKAFFGRG